jgi:metal-sulfur cluster biosynthetic enzyme
MITQAAVLDALSGVRDPELDEPVTDLGFVNRLDISGGEVSVGLQLPTYFCAPNFAYLMVDDARRALLALPGVESARVALDDHHASGEINSGVEGGHDFDASFIGEETSGQDLEEVRETFRRKAFVRRQEMLCRALMAEGTAPEELARMTLSGLPDTEASEVYLSRRAELGLDLSNEAPFLMDPDGNTVPEEAVVTHLKRARLTRISVEGNGAFCREVLASRYGAPQSVSQS